MLKKTNQKIYGLCDLFTDKSPPDPDVTSGYKEEKMEPKTHPETRYENSLERQQTQNFKAHSVADALKERPRFDNIEIRKTTITNQEDLDFWKKFNRACEILNNS